MDVSGFSHKAVFQPGTHCISKLVLILWIFFFFLSTAESHCKRCSGKRQPFIRKLTFLKVTHKLTSICYNQDCVSRINLILLLLFLIKNEEFWRKLYCNMSQYWS